MNDGRRPRNQQEKTYNGVSGRYTGGGSETERLTLIKGRSFTSIGPRVCQNDGFRPVLCHSREISPIPERLLNPKIQEMMQPRINIDTTGYRASEHWNPNQMNRKGGEEHSHEVLGPFQGICMEVVTIACSTLSPPTVCFPDAV